MYDGYYFFLPLSPIINWDSIIETIINFFNKNKFSKLEHI